jgi:hypothetical protein
LSLLARSLAAGFLSVLTGLAIGLHGFAWPQIEGILTAIPYRCPLKLFTGFECAFCGMTHSWIAILRGEWMQAVRFNFLGPAVFLAAVGVAIAILARVDLQKKIRPWMGVVAIVVLAGYTVIRNF